MNALVLGFAYGAAMTPIMCRFSGEKVGLGFIFIYLMIEAVILLLYLFKLSQITPVAEFDFFQAVFMWGSCGGYMCVVSVYETARLLEKEK